MQQRRAYCELFEKTGTVPVGKTIPHLCLGCIGGGGDGGGGGVGNGNGIRMGWNGPCNALDGGGRVELQHVVFHDEKLFVVHQKSGMT